MPKLRWSFTIVWVCLLGNAAPSWAQLDAAIPTEQLTPFLKTFSILTEHRPYLGASSLKNDNSIGLEVGVEALLMRMPDDLLETLGSSSIAFFPAARLHLAWGITPAVDVSSSGLWYLGTYFVGGMLKVKIWEPVEGPAWAIRLSGNFTHLDFSSLPIQMPSISITGADSTSVNVILETAALSPQLVVSKRMTWAEPYGFVGMDISTAISILTGDTTATVAGQTVSQQSSSTSTRLWYYGASAGTGIIFRIPYIGMKIALEGSYSSLGMPTLGTQIGVSF